ncbi:hypothetical protein ABZ958_09485 [Streptomyces sp. NPDC046237]|uniref:hypothetical protein n=1 Tax=Streptomyces sp. NPDC046237 TaxID=3154914 RepID=UPI0033E2AD91
MNRSTPPPGNPPAPGQKMLDDPRVDLSTARSTIWGAVAPALGIDPAFPDV